MTAKSFSVNGVKCLDFDEVMETQNNKSEAAHWRVLEGKTVWWLFTPPVGALCYLYQP